MRKGWVRSARAPLPNLGASGSFPSGRQGAVFFAFSEPPGRSPAARGEEN